MRLSRLLIPAGVLVVLLLPHIGLAASIGSFDPIIPQSGSCTCPGTAPGWGCVLLVLQHVINTAVSLGVVLSVLYLAYSGALLVTSAGNPSAREQAKQRMTSWVVGMVVLLTAWLIVDFIMKTIYGGQFGPWNSILASNGNDYCLVANEHAGNIISGAIDVLQGASTGAGGTLTLPSTGTGSCSASDVSAGAATGGYPLSNNGAAALACIAQNESGCGANNQNYNWGKGSSAYGPFQILLGNNGASFNNNACDAAVGLPNGTSLNCNAGFTSGNVSNSTIANQCMKAAANLQCSAAAVSKLTNGGSTQALKTAYGSSPNDLNCIAQHS